MEKTKRKGFSFVLKDSKATNPTSIIFQIYITGQRYRRSIGTIHPASWDFQDHRPVSKSKDSREIGKIIDAISDIVPVVKTDCRRNNRLIAAADLDAALDIILQTTKKELTTTPKQRDMLKDFALIIDGMRDGTILTPGKNKKRYRESTIRNYEKKALPALESFFKKRELRATYENVTIQLYSSFIAWCHEKNASDNYIGSFIKCWKRMGVEAFNKGWHSNPVFENREFAILSEITDDIYLDEAKIEKIYHQKVDEETHGIARDWFVLDCYLGLRISDLRRVSTSDFEGEYFQFVNAKTGATVAIKINRFVRGIIDKWKGLPPEISDSDLNEHIKAVAKGAKLKAKFIYKITKGGKQVVETFEEWQMVSSHTCRRSFITNLIKNGFKFAQVMRLAGIKRTETLMRYYKETPQEVAEETGKHEFFR